MAGKSVSKLKALHASLKRARDHVKNSNAKGPLEQAGLVGTGVVSAIGSSMLLGVMPAPASLGKWAPVLKSGIQAGGGAGLMMIKNKYAKAAGFTMLVMGIADMIRRVSPVQLPVMAGDGDEMVYGDREGGRNLNTDELDALRRMSGGGDPLGDPLGEPLGNAASGPFRTSTGPFG